MVKSTAQSLVPGQLAGVLVSVATGSGFTVTVAMGEVQRHPAAEVTVTLYIDVSVNAGVVYVVLVAPAIQFQTVQLKVDH